MKYSLRLRVDSNGSVKNSFCECPAGAGDEGTCKHVAAALLTIVLMKDTKDMCGVNSSCTDALQSFHKPKKMHVGEAVMNFKPNDFTAKCCVHQSQIYRLYSLVCNAWEVIFI